MTATSGLLGAVDDTVAVTAEADTPAVTNGKDTGWYKKDAGCHLAIEVTYFHHRPDHRRRLAAIRALLRSEQMEVCNLFARAKESLCSLPL